MFDLHGFSFVLSPDTKGHLWFYIRYIHKDDPDNAIIMDTVDAWIDTVREHKDRTPEEMVKHIREGVWHDVETGFREECRKANETIDENSFQKAIEFYFAVMLAIAEGVDCNISNPYSGD